MLTLTAGTRHFRFDNSSAGSVLAQFRLLRGRRAGQRMPCTAARLYSYNLNEANLADTESGFKSRGESDLAHHTGRHGVLHVLAGLPPGRLQPERRFAACLHGPDGVPQYFVPRSYHSDKLTNNEIGWKTEFLDHRLQWNGAVYRENWNNVQVAFFDPGVVGNIFFNTNGQNFLIKGVETSLVARVVDRADAAGRGILEPEPADEFARC